MGARTRNMNYQLSEARVHFIYENGSRLIRLSCNRAPHTLRTPCNLEDRHFYKALYSDDLQRLDLYKPPSF